MEMDVKVVEVRVVVEVDVGVVVVDVDVLVLLVLVLVELVDAVSGVVSSVFEVCTIKEDNFVAFAKVDVSVSGDVSALLVSCHSGMNQGPKKSSNIYRRRYNRWVSYLHNFISFD